MRIGATNITRSKSVRERIRSTKSSALRLLMLLAPLVFVGGCAGLISQNAQQVPPQTYSLSGTISPVAGGNGTTVTLSGAGNATTTANSSGAFTFTGLANGTYTLTPSRTGYTFSPTSQNVTVNGATVTGVSFTATQQTNPTYSISGTISPAAGGSGAVVTLSGAANASTTANSSGAFTFSGLSNGSYTLAPSLAGYTYSPASQNTTINGANVTGVNFTATARVAPTYSISGTISPTAGGSGATVTLSGAASGSTTANSSGVYTFTGLANGAYTVTPSNTGYTFTPVNQNVTVNGANAGAVNFTAAALAPSITTLNPTSGSVGTPVTISGTNFGGTQGSSTVKFNGVAATPTTWTATSIVAPVPAGATTGNVVVTVGGVASNGVSFTVNVPPPSIASLNPTSGVLATPVTISGVNFGASQGTSTVTFNGIAATPTSWSATSIIVPVPAGATTGNVVVTVAGAASNGVNFTVTAPGPSITNLNPASGLVGTSVTISGANFGATQGTSTVTFNGITVVPTSWSATSIVATVPTGATTGNVVVTVGGVASNGVSFTVTVPPPNITSLAPTSGTVGTSVTITGTNFGATQGTSTVKFNGTAATPTNWSATSIVAPVPTGATTGNVVVTVGGAASNGVSFTVNADTTPPVVTITAPANNATVSGTITLTATATDPDSPVSFVQFRVDGANTGTQLTTAPYSLSLDTTTLSNATHSLTAVAQDPSGNVGTSAAVTITVSNTAPPASPTLIYSTAVPLAIPSGSSWNGPGSCTTSQPCYRIPLPEPTTAGATLVLAFSYDSGSSNQVFSVTDSGSDAWVLDVTSTASNNKTMKMYRALSVAAGVTWINVQLTSGAQNGYWNGLVAEFYNVGALDVSSCSTGSSGTISSGNMTPTQTGDLIFQAKYSAGLSSQTTSFTPGSQPNITWSLASQLLGDGAADQYGVYNSTVTLNPTFTQAASDSYISCAVALRAASAGTAPPAIPRVVPPEHAAMPKNAGNPWNVGLVVDVANSAVYLSRVGNDPLTSVSSSPAPTVGWTPSGVDFNGLNGHNHVNFYCAQWTTPPGPVTLSLTRSGTSNDAIEMIYVVQNGTCNLDVDSGGQAGSQGSIGPLTTCANCLTPTKQNDFIMANGGQAYCTATSLSSPSGGIFDSAWFTGNTIDGPTQTDENNFWMHFYNGSSLSAFTITFNESCDFSQGDWAGRVAAYQSN